MAKWRVTYKLGKSYAYAAIESSADNAKNVAAYVSSGAIKDFYTPTDRIVSVQRLTDD